MDTALDLEAFATDKYSGGYFFDEMQGMADATGLDFEVIWLNKTSEIRFAN